MNTTRPNIGDLFEHAGKQFRVSAIAPTVLVGTLTSIEGTPTDPTQITCIALAQYQPINTGVINHECRA